MLLYRLLYPPTPQAVEYFFKFPATVSETQVKYSVFDGAFMLSFTGLYFSGQKTCPFLQP